MKLSLQLKLGQQLTMTPQLQQAIRLLQLSTLDLQQEIHQALETNPMLELIENDEEETALSQNSVAESSDSPAMTSNEVNLERPMQETEEPSWEDQIPTE